jgi:SRSO17 transposase
LLLPGERKSIEPMAARLDPAQRTAMRQSLHHLVAKAPWSDQALLEQVRQQVLPAMQKHGPVVAWIVDDTGFPKKGKHSVGVARQYCGQVGQTGKLPSSGEPVGGDMEFESADRLSSVSAQRLGRG